MDHEGPCLYQEGPPLEELPELDDPLELEPPPMPPPEPPPPEFPLELFSERAKAGCAATFLTVGVVFLAGVALLAAGSSLANSVLAPGSKMQLCRIAPEPVMNVEHNRMRMISLLFM
ncbi:hypothetical protein [Rhizobium leguminosarum]|nr:hypothetical protein [Rhizobium leguminosarum]